MTTPDYDPTSGYQPNGGWGYHEWGAAANEAWANAGEATQNGDSSTAAEWTAIAQQADANSSAVYVGGGPGYGSGGDSSGYNDGTYWGQGAVPDQSAATPTYETPTYETPTYETPTYETPTYETPTYETPTYETPSYETATPSYETPTYETPTYETATPSYETPSYDTSATSYDTSATTDTSSGMSEFGHADLALGF